MSTALADACTHPGVTYELRYPCFCDPERSLRFPCNAQGRVELDALSAGALDAYLYARVLVGREYGKPDVVSHPAN